MAKRDEALPLRYQTPGSWATAALTEPIKLLNDHAHLEKKAASNALELLNRWPQPVAPENWETTLTAIARDEVEHLQAVVRLLHRRGSRLTQNHRNTYASDLRSLVRMGQGTDELIDRLMISAPITLEVSVLDAPTIRGSGREPTMTFCSRRGTFSGPLMNHCPDSEKEITLPPTLAQGPSRIDVAHLARPA